MTTARADPNDLALALELADLADSLTMAAFRRSDLVVETKPDLTPVTEADRGVEEAIRQRLATERPGDAVLGEEYGATGDAARRWVIDPIDGTKNFVRGIPVWGTLVALEVDEQGVVAVASAPALGRRWWAGRGLGAFAATPGQPGTRVQVSKVADLADAQLSYSDLEGWRKRDSVERVMDLGLRCWRSRAFGDFWSHLLVAEGACDIGLDPEATLWDLAAVAVIVEEAGGCFTDLEGRHGPGGGSGVSTNGLLHQATLDVLSPSANSI